MRGQFHRLQTFVAEIPGRSHLFSRQVKRSNEIGSCDNCLCQVYVPDVRVSKHRTTQVLSAETQAIQIHAVKGNSHQLTISVALRCGNFGLRNRVAKQIAIFNRCLLQISEDNRTDRQDESRRRTMNPEPFFSRSQSFVLVFVARPRLSFPELSAKTLQRGLTHMMLDSFRIAGGYVVGYTD